MSVYSERSATVQRFVITFIGKDGLRTLAFPQQGRYTRATREEAEAWLANCRLPHSLPRVLTAEQLATLEVRECECWAGHFDPCGVYFD